MAKLILMRHGQSVWNARNLFTGWVDVPLSEKGVEEALEGGKKIADLPIDVVFTSSLIRAQMTGMLALLHHHSQKTPQILHEGQGNLEAWARINDPKIATSCMPIYYAWQLNERYYGDLQGLNKAEMMEKYGKEQVQVWRRSFRTAPPNGESLAMTTERVIPYFKDQIVPYLEQGKHVFIPAHGNSLRAIIMYLDGLSEDEVVKLELATGDPIVYDYTESAFSRCPIA
ncbi:MAG: 2,3-bisphosphoglycerate-dependent phosphoglycerate mutase [Chlamydiia bacterium]|nr:2,3-bisphosphoglycerate-dependent phosphoglycerate mutase [Chlamydiia bacterium]